MTVLRLLRADELALHRAQICAWLRANGIEPNSVHDGWISIEQVDQEPPVIRCRTFKVGTDGRRLVDPNDDTRVWTEQLTRPLAVALPELAANAMTERAMEPMPQRPAHGTDDSYPYGGDYDAGHEYRLTCYCGREFTGELDGTVERDFDEHVSDMADGQAL